MYLRCLQLHTKKRNKLAQSRLNDLVFVKSNRALKHRREESTSRDPILLKDIDESNEWLLERMEGDSDEDDLVFEDDTLTWAAVAQACGANEPCYGTRSRGSKSTTTSKTSTNDKGKASASTCKSSQAQIQLIDEDGEEEYEEDEEEEEEEEDIRNEDEVLGDDVKPEHVVLDDEEDDI